MAHLRRVPEVAIVLARAAASPACDPAAEPRQCFLHSLRKDLVALLVGRRALKCCGHLRQVRQETILEPRGKHVLLGAEDIDVKKPLEDLPHVVFAKVHRRFAFSSSDSNLLRNDDV